MAFTIMKYIDLSARIHNSTLPDGEERFSPNIQLYVDSSSNIQKFYSRREVCHLELIGSHLGGN